MAGAREEIAESKKAVDVCQTEFKSLKVQRAQLEAQVEKQTEDIKQLEATNTKLMTELDARKKREVGIFF